MHQNCNNKKTLYVTTPIYYASGEVHIGNSYSTVICDAFARYYRKKGYDTFFLTGMDEHGQKIQTASEKNGILPQEYVDEIAQKTKTLWSNLKITNDDFIRTSDERHIKTVQAVFEKWLENGDIYLGSYEGNYCVPCEAFYTKTQLNPDGTCPDCGRPTTKVKEESYFLKLKKYEKPLLDYIESHPDFIQPESRRNEVVSFIKQGLDDLCASRASFSWGVPILSNPKHVVYVWIDALLNYVSALGYGTENDELYKKYWLNGTRVAHVIGKDILRFHAVYWPIMLMAAGIPINFQLYAHGWILMKEGKMSKSKGNFVYPMDIVNEYGLDSLRYYLVREMPVGNDGLFSWERFVERYNVDLANDLGNLVSRSISMINKYFDGFVCKPVKNIIPIDDEVEALANKVIQNACTYFESFQFQNGLIEIWTLVSRMNKYIDETTPWVLAKDPSKKEELNDVMYHLFESLRIVSILVECVIPDTSKIILDELNVKEEERSFSSLKFGMVKEAKVIEKPIVLFKRLDMAEELKKHE